LPDFVGILRRLREANVDFVLVGGLAAAAHGCSLITQDVDVCIRLGSENLERLQDALNDFEPVHRMARQRIPFEHDAATLATFRDIYLYTRLGRLDCLGMVLGIGDFDAVVRRSVEVEIDGTLVRIISIDALIEAKVAMNRDRDKLAVDQLRAIKRIRDPDTR
jgi:hypothetical protein